MVHDDILKKFDDVKNNSVAMQSLNSKGAEDFEEKVSKKLQNHYVLLRNNVSKNYKVVSVMLTDIFTHITRKPTITEFETIQKEVQTRLAESLTNINARFSSILSDEMSKQGDVQLRVLNSIDDLKLTASSTAKLIQDNLPFLQEIRCDISQLPDDIARNMAALEENLCVNLETNIREIDKFNLQSILRRFDAIEYRMAVIRKYVKYGSGPTRPSNQEHNTLTADEKFGTAEQIKKLLTIQNQCLDMLKVIPPNGKNVNTQSTEQISSVDLREDLKLSSSDESMENDLCHPLDTASINSKTTVYKTKKDALNSSIFLKLGNFRSKQMSQNISQPFVPFNSRNASKQTKHVSQTTLRTSIVRDRTVSNTSKEEDKIIDKSRNDNLAMEEINPANKPPLNYSQKRRRIESLKYK